MGIINTNRAAYQHPTIHRIGNRKPRPVRTDAELNKIHRAITSLNEAKQATSEPEYLVKLTDAMRIVRDIWQSRQ
jgi:hypothetical protein